MLQMTLFMLMLSSNQELAQFKGTVSDANGQLLNPLYISIENQIFSKKITCSGTFEIEDIPFGTYLVTFESPGFESLLITIEMNQSVVEQQFQLQPKSLSIKETVVSPRSFAVLDNPTQGGTFMDQDMLQKTPHFGGDILRALETLPGTSSTDFGSAFRVRNSASRETKVVLDGMSLYNPYHLKDFSGVFSYLDPEIMSSLELSSGGFSTKYGDALSGVLNISSKQPTKRRTSASLSFGNLGVVSEGTIAEGKGNYLVSFRRGYIDLLLRLGGQDEDEGEQDIVYMDSFAKLAFVLGERHNLSINALFAQDDFLEKETEEGEVEDSDSNYKDIYSWVNLTSIFSDRLTSSLTAYWTDLTQDRITSSFGGDEEHTLLDNRSVTQIGLRWDLEYEHSERFFLRGGFEFADIDTDFNYATTYSSPIGLGLDTPDISYTGTPQDQTIGAYITGRFKISDQWLAEMGVRFDQQDLLDENQISPRMNLAWTPDSRQTLRFGIGRFAQAEHAHELQLSDGLTTFSKPELSDQAVLGYEFAAADGSSLRFDAYHRTTKDVRPRFENLTRSFVRFPGLSYDRVGFNPEESTSYGLEFTWSKRLGKRWDGFVHYAWSRYEHDLGDRKIRDPYEQEHNAKFALNWQLGSKWHINGTWHYHTGWRTTPLTQDETDPNRYHMGEWFSDKFDDYHRLDLRINRDVVVRGKRQFTLFIDVYNAYNRKNVRGLSFEFTEVDGERKLISETEEWLPIMPTFGLTWRF